MRLKEWLGGSVQRNDDGSLENEKPSTISLFNAPSSSDTNQLTIFEPDLLGNTTKDLLKVLSFSPIDVDDISRLTGLETRHVTAALMALDIEGRIERHAHGYVTLKA